jgi:uncharacterized cofD-like protein
VVLVAEHNDGSITEGEDNIPKAHLPIKRVKLKPAAPQATPEALKAIEEADIIVLGPGSLFTSILPNLLISEITNAIAASDAIKVYVCNIMTQPGETDGYSASGHIKNLINHSHPRVIDYCLVNTGKIPEETLRRYRQENSCITINDTANVERMGYRVIEDDFVLLTDNVIRHDPVKLARIILGITEEV